MISQPRVPVWVRDEDLVQTVYELRVVNSATKTKAGSPRDAEILELGTDTVNLRVPQNLCALGHLLSIELTFRKNPGNHLLHKLVMTGKVLGGTAVDENFVLVTVRLYQFDETGWHEFRKKHEQRQIRVSEAILERQS